jgi:putative transposase
MVSPQAKREAVTLLLTERDFGVTRACGLVGISRSLYRYRSRRPDSAALRSRIEEIAAIKRRYGYRRVYLRLRREGWPAGDVRVVSCMCAQSHGYPLDSRPQSPPDIGGQHDTETRLE